MECRNLSEVRENIDRIDRELVRLIGERGGYVRQAARFKTDSAGVQDPARVEAVIAKVRSLAEETDGPVDLVEQLYRGMIKGFIELEQAEFDTKNG